MKVGDRVEVNEFCEHGALVGKRGKITKVLDPKTWDDPECPEYLVDLGIGENDEGDEFSMADCFFNATEIDRVV